LRFETIEDPRLTGVLELHRELSTSKTLPEMILAFVSQLRRSGVTHFLNLDVRGLEPGEFRVMDRIHAADPRLSPEHVRAHSRWEEPLESIPARRSAILSTLVEAAAPALARGIEPEADEVLAEFMAERTDCLVVPVFREGTIAEWLLMFMNPGAHVEPLQIQAAVSNMNLFARMVVEHRQARLITALHDQLAAQMQEVGRVQRSILPHHPPPVRGLDIAVHYEPSETAGGDYYDFRQFDDGNLGIVIADVSGHGPAAAVVMAMLRTVLSTNRLENRPAQTVVQETNRFLCDGMRNGMFVTALFVAIDPATGNVRYANAGHPPPRLRAADGTVRCVGEEGGPPLGIMTNLNVGGGTFRLEPGETLLAYTDGLFEARDARGAMLGIEGLDEALAQVDGSAEAILERVIGRVRAHEAGRKRADDQCAIVVRRYSP